MIHLSILLGKTWKESLDFFFKKSGVQMQLGGPLINVLFVFVILLNICIMT